MNLMRGPALFVAQYLSDQEPFNSLPALARWAASLGFEGLQLPTLNKRIFDLDLASRSDAYCEEVVGVLAEHGLVITELSTHLQGQLVAVHPAYDSAFDSFAPPEYRQQPAARQRWAVGQMLKAADASRRLKLSAHATFSGAFVWPYVYPWPQRDPQLVESAFTELARRWRPILDAFDAAGVDLCYEVHPGEDLHDGVSFERFLDKVDDHPRCHILYDPSHLHLQQLDYLQYLDFYHQRIRMFHVKDAEFHPTGRQGVYGGYQDWIERAGRFRSPGDGQIDFRGIFSKLAQYRFKGWAVLEWECCLKHPEDGAREGAQFIRDHLIRVTDRSFDDFAASSLGTREVHRMLGIETTDPTCGGRDVGATS